MPSAELSENEELAKTQGQFEGENTSNAEAVGEASEVMESQGLEQMSIEAEQDVSQTLESAQTEIGKEFDVIAHYEAAFTEDVDAAKKEGDNILAQNEQDAQEAKGEIKSAMDLAKESSEGQMTELEKKWASENGGAETAERNAEAIIPKATQALKQETVIADKTEELPKQEDVKEDDKNASVKRFIKISSNILGKDAPIQVEKNNASAAQDSEKQYVKISPDILGKDMPIDLSERGEAPMPEASKQEDVKEEEDKYKPRDSKFIKISKDILGKESTPNNEREKIPDQLMKEAKEIFEKIPDNEKRGFFKGISALGFKSNELKGRFFKKIFGEMAKKANDWTEKGEQSLAARLCSSYADIYQGVEDQAKAKQDQLYNQKGGALNTAAGIAALAGNALLYGRIAADVTQVNPMRGVTATAMTLGRGGEAMKEAHLKSHNVITDGRIQKEYEDEAYDQAMVLYEQAKEKSPDGKVNAENLSKIYKENLPKDLLNRIDKDQGKEGICSRIAQKIAKADIEYSLKKIDKQIKSVESDDDLSPSAKAAAKNKILKKYDKFLKDMDRLVANSGKVDMIAYGSRLTEKAGKATASFMMLETLAEGIASGAEALAALPSGESDSSPEFSFQESDAEFDPAGATLEDGIITEEAPIETDAKIVNPEIAESAEPAEDNPIESVSESQPEPAVIKRASTLEEAGVSESDVVSLSKEDLTKLSPEQIAGIHDYNLKVDALKNAGFSQEDLDQLSDDDIKSFTAEQIRQHALENQINANFDAHAQEIGAHNFEDINNKAAMESMKNNLPKDSFETGSIPLSESGGEQIAQASAIEEKTIGEEGEVITNEYAKETSYEGKASDIQEPVVDTNIPSAAKTFGRRFINVENLQKIAQEKGMSEQMLRNEATDAGSEVNRYVEMYKDLIKTEGKGDKADKILQKITETTTRYESKYGSGFLDKASILESLKK